MDKVQEAIKNIEEDDRVDILRQCKSIKERFDKLMEFMPDMWLWNLIPARQLIFYLQRAYRIDFGVCDFYTIEGSKQYCRATGIKVECLCAIPEAYCVYRDKNGKPKYPEFFPILLLEEMQGHKGCYEL